MTTMPAASQPPASVPATSSERWPPRAPARTATVTAASAFRLLIVERTRFAEFIREAPSAALMVSREAARRRDRRRNRALP